MASALQIDSDKKGNNNNPPSTRPSGLSYQKYLNHQLLEMFNVGRGRDYLWLKPNAEEDPTLMVLPGVGCCSRVTQAVLTCAIWEYSPSYLETWY